MRRETKSNLQATEKNKGGRPVKFSDSKAKIVIDAVRRGAYYKTAAESAGVSDTTFRKWDKQGEEELESGNEDGRFARFLRSLKSTESALELELAEDCQQSARGNTLMTMLFMARRWPQRWQEKRDISVPDGGTNIQINLVSYEKTKPGIFTQEQIDAWDGGYRPESKRIKDSVDDS